MASVGTLSDWLAAHPSLRRGIGPPDHRNELHFFDSAVSNATPPGDAWRRYAARFPLLSDAEAAAGVQTFEKSPSYARFPNAPKLLAGLLPSAHVVVTLRDPVDRAYSAFSHHARHGAFAKIETDRLAAPRGAVRSVAPGCDVRSDRIRIFSLDQRRGYVHACARPRDVNVLDAASADADAFDAYRRPSGYLVRVS